MPDDGQHPGNWLDPDSQLVVDWTRGVMMWCQRSVRRIMYAHFQTDYPTLVLVNHVCRREDANPARSLLLSAEWTSRAALLLRSSRIRVPAETDRLLGPRGGRAGG